MNTKLQNIDAMSRAFAQAVGLCLNETQLFSRVNNLIMSTNAHFSHRFSLARGYLRLDQGRIEFYDGRFGYGIKVHHPNMAFTLPNGRKSSRYYVVEYLTISEL